MHSRDYAALVVLSALWGGSYLFMRVAAPSLGPILLVEVRVLLAGLTLLGYAAVTRGILPLGGRWRDYLVVGLINSALPFVLISTAELYLPASFAAILNATTPLFTALVASAWLRESVGWRKVLGLSIGFSGVAMLAGLGPVPLTPTTLWSSGALLAASFSYGIAAVYIKVRAKEDHPRTLALYSQLFAALLLAPMVPFAVPAGPPSRAVIASVLMLALLSTVVAYLIYFRLIATVGPTKTTMVAYLVPVFGMLWGALFLGERLGATSFLGFGLIAGSIALVTGARERGLRGQPIRAVGNSK